MVPATLVQATVIQLRPPKYRPPQRIAVLLTPFPSREGGWEEGVSAKRSAGTCSRNDPAGLVPRATLLTNPLHPPEQNGGDSPFAQGEDVPKAQVEAAFFQAAVSQGDWGAIELKEQPFPTLKTM